MKDFKSEIQYKGKTYSLAFNLNVMESIQEEYGTIDHWGELTDGSEIIIDEKGKKTKVPKEPNAKAVIFGFREMLNEGIDIENEEHGTDLKPFTLKQVGRIITEVGLREATLKLNQTVIDSTKSEEKN